ncbi:MAG: hypothetical protein U1E98_04295 [Moraxella osloensis]
MKTWSVAILPVITPVSISMPMPTKANEGHGYTAVNATLLGNGAEARFNQGNGFVIGQSGFLDGSFLMAYGNAGYGYHLDHCQAFMPYARGWKNALGRMHKSIVTSLSNKFSTPCRVLPTVLLAFAPFNLLAC